MTSTYPHPLTGADVPAALRALYAACRIDGPAQLSELDRQLAWTLSVSPRTIRRWRTGAGRPSLDNFDRLKARLHDWQASVLIHGDAYFKTAARQRSHTELAQAAYDALMTDADRQRERELAEDIARHLSELRKLNGV